jgi:putative glutamine amidotransferase
VKRRPLKIGVSARIQYGDPAKIGYLKKNIYYLEHSYAQYILAHDAMPFLVPDLAGHRQTSLTLADYAAELDGLMLQGGTDISPQSYGEAPLKPEWGGDPPRDRYELELLNRFIEAKKPVLGICRGHQLINVALGGTLYQDTLTQVAGSHVHSDLSVYDDHYHHVRIEPGSGLAHVYPGKDTVKVNTLHHQAVKDLGRGLVIEARSAEDGIVEAIRYTGDQYLVGVQWHPEFIHDRDPELLDGSPLMEEFLRAARAPS